MIRLTGKNGEDLYFAPEQIYLIKSNGKSSIVNEQHCIESAEEAAEKVESYKRKLISFQAVQTAFFSKLTKEELLDIRDRIESWLIAGLEEPNHDEG